MNDPLMIYIGLSAIICLLWVHYDLFYSEHKEDFQEKLEAFHWDTGISPSFLIALLYLSIAWFGWAFLPIKIFNNLKRV